MEVLQALLNQTRLPGVIHVVVNNSTDETFYVARELAAPHQNVCHLGQRCGRGLLPPPAVPSSPWMLPHWVRTLNATGGQQRKLEDKQKGGSHRNWWDPPF